MQGYSSNALPAAACFLLVAYLPYISILKMDTVSPHKILYIFTRLHGVTSQKISIFQYEIFLLIQTYRNRDRQKSCR
jgi:hypothetical protein